MQRSAPETSAIKGNFNPFVVLTQRRRLLAPTDFCRLVGRIAAWTSIEAPGEHGSEVSSQRSNRIGDVPFGPDRVHRGVGNRWDRSVSGTSQRHQLLRGNAAP